MFCTIAFVSHQIHWSSLTIRFCVVTGVRVGIVRGCCLENEATPEKHQGLPSVKSTSGIVQSLTFARPLRVAFSSKTRQTRLHRLDIHPRPWRHTSNASLGRDCLTQHGRTPRDHGKRKRDGPPLAGQAARRLSIKLPEAAIKLPHIVRDQGPSKNTHIAGPRMRSFGPRSAGPVLGLLARIPAAASSLRRSHCPPPPFVRLQTRAPLLSVARARV